MIEPKTRRSGRPRGGWDSHYKEFARQEIERALARKGWTRPRWLEGGESDRYLKAELKTPDGEERIAIFVYGDEVGFLRGGSWTIAERPDFESAEEQVAWIVRRLLGA